MYKSVSINLHYQYQIISSFKGPFRRNRFMVNDSISNAMSLIATNVKQCQLDYCELNTTNLPEHSHTKGSMNVDAPSSRTEDSWHAQGKLADNSIHPLITGMHEEWRSHTWKTRRIRYRLASFRQRKPGNLRGLVPWLLWVNISPIAALLCQYLPAGRIITMGCLLSFEQQ